MLSKKLCHNLLSKALVGIHQKRRDALEDMTNSLLNGSHLTLTSIGRHLTGKAQVKNKIKRVDRFLGNEGVFSQVYDIYSYLSRWSFQNMQELFIFVDWSGCCDDARHVITASVMYKGRSIPIFNEITNKEDMETEQTHDKFLENLRQILPEGPEITIVTDAGFKTPWFAKVRALGWHFIGRVRGRVKCSLADQPHWQSVSELHDQAQQEKVTRLGVGTLGKTSKSALDCYFFLYKSSPKGRKKKKQKGKSIFPQHEQRCRSMNKEPWVLVSSHDNSLEAARQITRIYKGRMQIEQNFRDEKSERFGMGFRYSRTKNLKRLAILFLLATIALYVLWWIGMTAEKKKIHWHFQANTIKNKRVLSIIFLAKQIIKHGIKTINIRDCNRALIDFRENYRGLVLCD